MEVALTALSGRDIVALAICAVVTVALLTVLRS